MNEQCRDRKIPAADLNLGFVRIGGCCLNMIQCVQYIEHCLLQICTNVESQMNVTVSGPDVTRHFYNAGYLPKRVFLWFDNAGLHFLRRGVAPGSVDIDLRILEIRQHLDGQRRDTDYAEHEHEDRRCKQRGRIVR